MKPLEERKALRRERRKNPFDYSEVEAVRGKGSVPEPEKIEDDVGDNADNPEKAAKVTGAKIDNDLGAKVPETLKAAKGTKAKAAPAGWTPN